MSGFEQLIEGIVRRVVREELEAFRASTAVAGGLLTIQAYAASRSVSVSTVRAAIREGRLPTKSIGRGTKRAAVRIPADADIAPPAASRRSAKPAAPAANADRILSVVRGGRS